MMDCLICHNRPLHPFRAPARAERLEDCGRNELQQLSHRRCLLMSPVSHFCACPQAQLESV